MNTFVKSLEVNLNNWRLYLVMGIVFLLTGIWGFTEQLSDYIAFEIFISIAILVSGILKITFSLLDKKTIDNWKGSFANGVTVLFLGTILIYLNLPIETLALFAGVFLLRYAYNAIAHIFEMKNQVNHWIWFAALSILGGLSAFLVILYPWFSILTRVFYASLAFFLLGIFDIVYAFIYRKPKTGNMNNRN